MPARDRTVIRLPSFEVVSQDPCCTPTPTACLHLETNPGNAAPWSNHGEGGGARRVDQPAAHPLTTPEMDLVSLTCRTRARRTPMPTATPRSLPGT